MTAYQKAYECKNCGKSITETSGLCKNCADGFENLQVIAAKRLLAGNPRPTVINQLVARAAVTHDVAVEIVNLSQNVLNSDEFREHLQTRKRGGAGRTYLNKDIVWGLICIGGGAIVSLATYSAASGETYRLFWGVIIYGI